MDPKDLCAKITSKSCAIIPVHLYGRMAHMDTICDIALKNNLKIIEDAAQALGSKIGGNMLERLQMWVVLVCIQARS